MTLGGVWCIIHRNDDLAGIWRCVVGLRGIVMYKIFMLIALPIIGIGWIGYAIWIHKIRKEEETQPKQVSERLSTTRSEVSDWAQKMKNVESPREKALKRRRELEAQRLREEQAKQRESEN